MKKNLREIYEDFCKNHDFSGTCLVKQGDEILLSEACGMAHKGFLIPNAIDTKFDTASVTKVFTATAILMLVEEGKLAFGDKITEILDLRYTEIPGDVTIEHLLTHTSGIADDADEENGEKYSDLFIDKPNYSIRKTADFLPQFAFKKPLFRAGTDVRYNNCAFVLLGLVIEKLSGKDYRSFIKDEILKPYGLKNTGFYSMDEVNENTAEGYFKIFDPDGNFLKWKKNIYSYPPVGSPDGGIYSTVEDLDRFIRLLKSGKLLSEYCTGMMFQPHCEYTRPLEWDAVPSARKRNGYALEFIEIDGKTFCVYKNGQNEGAGAMLSYYPESDVTVIILTNQDCNIWEMHRLFQTMLYTVGYSA